MASTPTTSQRCPSCGDERQFEQPPCLDGHGADCPEWVCIDCGHAIIVEFDLEVEADDTMSTVDAGHLTGAGYSVEAWDRAA